MTRGSKRLVECDGCGLQIRATKVELEVKLITCSCPNHWGWMDVGGRAWMDYHGKAIHPMQTFVDIIKRRVLN